MKNRQPKKKGFTIIEIMIAISVMAIGIVGVYAIVPRIILVNKINTNRFIAAQLAREGIELVRNIRDGNSLKEVNWDSDLGGCQSGCEMDYNDSSPSYYSGKRLRIDSNGFYNYGNGKQTNFSRKIRIIPNGNNLIVEVEVDWTGKYSPFILKEKLYDWR